MGIGYKARKRPIERQVVLPWSKRTSMTLNWKWEYWGQDGYKQTWGKGGRGGGQVKVLYI